MITKYRSRRRDNFDAPNPQPTPRRFPTRPSTPKNKPTTNKGIDEFGGFNQSFLEPSAPKKFTPQNRRVNFQPNSKQAMAPANLPVGREQNHPNRRFNRSTPNHGFKKASVAGAEAIRPSRLIYNKTQTGRPNFTQQNTPKPTRPVIIKNETNQPTIKKSVSRSNEAKLRIIPLGGMEEVGRNMTIFEYGDDIVILDMGLQFPEEDMFGIDFIIPNIAYLKGKEKNIRAVILSHGHLDHIGAAPILLEKLGYPPVIGRPLTLALLKNRQEDYKKNSTKLLKTIQVKDIKDSFSLGAFRLKFFAVDHSIMDAVGVILETPSATILHPGDWTLEKDASGRPHLNFTHLANLRRPTVLMLESLGATDIRPSASTQEMQKNLNQLLSRAKGRVVIGTFASQIERINWIIGEAEKLGKKVVLDGRSMKVNVAIAQELGYIKPGKHTLIKPEAMHEWPDNKIVILATGAQGESNASLSRILNGDHKTIKIQKTDTVIFSSSVIPGNERSIQTLKDKLYRQCDNVVHGEMMDIHVSGHANRSDILYILKQVKPDYFIPVYAYHYMLHEAKKLVQDAGYRPERVFILDNGQVAEFDRTGGKTTKEKVPADYVMVDGLGVGDVSDIVLRDRKTMAEDGMIVVISTIDSKTGNLVGSPDIISRGFIYMKENKELIQKTRDKIKTIIKNRPGNQGADDDYIKNKVRNDIGQFLFQQTMRRPMVLPVVIKV